VDQPERLATLDLQVELELQVNQVLLEQMELVD
jgi:hypothetical protein